MNDDIKRDLQLVGNAIGAAVFPNARTSEILAVVAAWERLAKILAAQSPEPDPKPDPERTGG